MTLERYVPLSPVQAERRMRDCAGRLLEMIDEHGVAAEEEASATADHKLTYAKAYLASTVGATERYPADYHKAVAEVAAGDQLVVMHAAMARRRTLSEGMHSLRQVLSSLQTNARAMSDVS